MFLYPARVTEEQRIRRAHALFESHREQQLETLFPPTSYFDASRDQKIDCWSDSANTLNKLGDLLPFGQVISATRFADFTTNDLDYLVKASQEQLLYWHLAGATTTTNAPTETLLLWANDDYLWFLEVLQQENDLINRVRRGERLWVLERFRLDYTEIQISFQELRLVTNSQPHQIVITEGREYTYKWSQSVWTTSLENPDSNLINPRIYHLPPDQPNNPEIVEYARVIFNRTRELETLPPSSQPLSTTLVSSNSGAASQWGMGDTCWCNKEVCDCGFRPNTPPTPPSVVLWVPGQSYLPTRE